MTGRYGRVRYSAGHFNAVRAIQHTVQHSGDQCNTVQCNTAQCATVEYSTGQYNAMQLRIQYNSILYSALQCIMYFKKQHC
jgi:hypothetical protein